VEYLEGLHLTRSILWLDAPRLAELCFVSNALLHPVGPHRRLLLSERTAALLGPGTGARPHMLVTPFYRNFVVGELQLQLAPSGHMPGASQLRIGRGRQQLVYTGDFNPRPSLCAERIHFWQAPRLVLKAHYGLAGDVFPAVEREQARALAWTEKVLAGGATAVWLYLHPPTALELHQLLGRAGYTPLLHRSLLPLADAYVRAGIRLASYRRSSHRARVIIWPWRLRLSSALSRRGRLQMALASGEVLRPDSRRRLGVEHGFCLSTRADRNDLLAMVERVGARKVYLTGRGAEEVAHWLGKLGLRASVLAPPRQLQLFGVNGGGGNSTDGQNPPGSDMEVEDQRSQDQPGEPA